MLFVNALLLLATTVSAAFHAARTAPTVLADLHLVDQDVLTLTQELNSWDGTTGHSIPLLQDEQKLEKDVNQTIIDVNNSAVFTCAEIGQIASYLNNTLEPDLVKLADALIKKKAAIQASGLYNVFKQYIANLRKEFATLFAALLNKSCASYQAQTSAVGKKVDNDFARVQAAFL